MNRRQFAQLLGFTVIAGCDNTTLSPVADMNKMSAEEQMRILGFRMGEPLFIRIFKQSHMLEVWMQQKDGLYHLYRTFPICTYSGTLGPKIHEGDYQSPEGFYQITPAQMNPNSEYHLAFNLGFPNAYDRFHGYTGRYLMVHGSCVSAGCYAMGNDQIETIYHLMEAAFAAGQKAVPVQIFPFPLTDANLAAYRGSRWYDFWKMLEPGYTYFESAHLPPTISVVGGRYVVDYLHN